MFGLFFSSLPLVTGDCAAVSGQMVLRMELAQLGTGSGLSCAVPCSVVNGVMCGFQSGWSCLLQDSSPSKAPYCAQTCQSNSECASGSTCNLGGKPLTMASVGICMTSPDPSVTAIQKAVIMAVTDQQRYSPITTASGMQPNTQFEFLTKNLADQLNQLSNENNLATNPTMMALRVNLAALIKLHPEGANANPNAIILGNDVQSYVEYAVDTSLHNILHPVSSLTEGTRGAIWDLRHPFAYRTLFNWLRGLLVFFILYSLVGCYYKANFEGATGLDRIPHLAFWLDYPQLVMDGVNFLIAKIVGGSAAGLNFLASARDSKYISARDSFANFEPIN